MPGTLSSQAEQAGLVVAYATGDALMEFEGAVTAKVDAYNGGIAHFTQQGLLTRDCEDYDCPYFKQPQRLAAPVHALWRAERGVRLDVQNGHPPRNV